MNKVYATYCGGIYTGLVIAASELEARKKQRVADFFFDMSDGIPEQLKFGTSIRIIEEALDHGHIQALVAVGRGSKERWWKVRRNGTTKRWKTDPWRFRIPVKCGLKICGSIESIFDFNGSNRKFRFAPDGR